MTGGQSFFDGPLFTLSKVRIVYACQMDTKVPFKSVSVSRFYRKVSCLQFRSFGVNLFYLLFTLSVNVTPTNELWEDYKTLISAKTLCFITFFLILSLLPIQKGGYVVYLQMWIPRYIDVHSHFSQNILNKGIFQMWIHHYGARTFRLRTFRPRTFRPRTFRPRTFRPMDILALDISVMEKKHTFCFCRWNSTVYYPSRLICSIITS